MAGSAHLATVGGFGAILLWSIVFAVSRSLSEQVGAVTAGAVVMITGGLLALVSLLLRPGRTRTILRLPRRYLLGCGTLFVFNILFLYLAIGFARDRSQLLEIALLNYLWPSLTLLLSLVILGKRADWILVPGTLAALAGIFLVLTQSSAISLASLTANVMANPWAYSAALGAAASWAVYSNLARKWAGDKKDGAMEIFLPASALVMVLLCCFIDEPREWSRRALAESLLLGGSSFFAYVLWDNAMRRGNVTTVVAASYMTPLFSTIASCAYLSVLPSARLWAGCGILIAGSFLSWRSISAKQTASIRS